MSQIAFEEIHRDEIDGIPTVWADLPGPYSAALVFRVGKADELPARSGITHLVEHLTLAPLGVQDYDHNGFVEPLRTSFHFSGPRDDVASFLVSVAGSLCDLRTDRLLVERAILKREAEESGIGLGDAIRGYRWGLGTLGLSAEEEFGIRWLGPDPVREWAAERFVRRNATLVLSGPPPDSLTLGLPDGERHPVPTPGHPGYLRLPAHVAWPNPAVTLTLVMPRHPASNMVANILHRRMRTRLRFDLGAVYDVNFDYDRISAEESHVVFATDCDEREVDRVQRTMLELVDELVANGPTPEELAGEVTSLRRSWEHDEARLGFIHELAFDALIGHRDVTPRQLLDERSAIQPAEAAAVLAGAVSSVMLFAPNENPVPDRLTSLPEWSADEVVGDAVGPVGFHLPGRGPKERLIVGADGVTLRLSGAERLTVRYRDVVAVVHDGETRTLHGRDGIRVFVDAALWRGGKAILERIDAATPSAALVCHGHSPGGLEDPEGRT